MAFPLTNQSTGLSSNDLSNFTPVARPTPQSFQKTIYTTHTPQAARTPVRPSRLS